MFITNSSEQSTSKVEIVVFFANKLERSSGANNNHNGRTGIPILGMKVHQMVERSNPIVEWTEAQY